MHRIWTPCTAFETEAGTVWVNDSITDNSARSMLCCHRMGNYRQVESISVSWCVAASFGTTMKRPIEVQTAKPFA